MANSLKDNPHHDLAAINKIALDWGRKKALSSLALAIGKLGLQDRSILINSLKAKTKKRAGDVESVRVEFAWYGLFHNTGATNAFGKGVNLPAKFWIGAGINPVIGELADKVSDYYADVVIKSIEFKTK